MSISLSIVIGIISGMITFVVSEVLKLVFTNDILPWIESKIYTGVDLTDSWLENYEASLGSTNPDIQVQDIELKLNQTVNKITGTCTLSDRSNVTPSLGVRQLEITGTTKNRYVSLTLELKNNKKFGIVNYLLEVTSEGDVMEGFTSYYDPEDKELRTAKTKLKRVQNNN